MRKILFRLAKFGLTIGSSFLAGVAYEAGRQKFRDIDLSAFSPERVAERMAAVRAGLEHPYAKSDNGSRKADTFR